MANDFQFTDLVTDVIGQIADTVSVLLTYITTSTFLHPVFLGCEVKKGYKDDEGAGAWEVPN